MVAFMKRYLTLCVLLIFLIPCMVVPASASSWTDSDVETALSGIEMIESAIYEWYLQYFGYFVEESETINDGSGNTVWVTPFKYDLIQIQMYVWSWTGTVFDDIKTDVSRLESYVYQIYQYTLNIPDVISDGFNTVKTWLSNINTILDAFYTKFYTSITQIFQPIKDYLESIKNTVDLIFRGDTSKSDSFQEDLVPIETEIDEMVEVLETSPSYDFDKIEWIFDDFGNDITGLDDTGVFALFLRTFLADSTILFLVMLCFCFAIIGFLLYGKR